MTFSSPASKGRVPSGDPQVQPPTEVGQAVTTRWHDHFGNVHEALTPPVVTAAEVADVRTVMRTAAALEGRDVLDTTRSHRAIHAGHMALASARRDDKAVRAHRHQIDVLTAVEKQIIIERQQP